MQSDSYFWGDDSSRVWRLLVIFGMATIPAFFSGCGCPGDQSPAIRSIAKPHAGVTLRIHCADERMAQALKGPIQGWAGRSGATVELQDVAAGDATSVQAAVIPAAALGEWVTRGDAAIPPAGIRGEDSAIHWTRILSSYRDRIASWGSELRAIPLAGEGYVLVYRADRLQDPAQVAAYREKFARPLTVPRTWEDIAELAAFFARDGQPSLPPVPGDPDRLLREFHFLAACYDRPALTETAIRTRMGGQFEKSDGLSALRFHFDPISGAPRLTNPAFVAAASWLHSVHPYRMAPNAGVDPVAALDTGTAVVALLTLRDLGRLPREDDAVSPRFGIAPLPGTASYFEPETGARTESPDRTQGGNFVPYYGDGAWLGVIHPKVTEPENAAVLELFAELAGPARSLDLLSDPNVGFGPFRAEHLEQQREGVWLRYGFEPERTRQLIDTQRQFMALTLANPVFQYRGPDEGAFYADLARHVRSAATGQVEPAQAMQAAQRDTLTRDATVPPDQLSLWRRKSAGLD